MMTSRTRLKVNSRRGQHGLASIIVVLMLVVVISLISLGFSKLADRATQQSLGNNLGAAAEYAARSGVNDVIALLKGIPNTESKNCDDLLKPDQPFAGAGSQLSGNQNTRYTCILIDKQPQDIVYQNTEPYKSRVIAVTPPDAKKRIKSFMFSWQSSERNPPPVYPGSSAESKLYDETYWSQSHFTPMLRLALYRTKPGGAAGRDMSVFLYPSQAADNKVTTIADEDLKDGSLLPVTCKSEVSGFDTGSFKGTADFDCDFILNQLSTKDKFIYYLRLTPLYAAADIKIKANDSKNEVIEFGGTQYVIDVTAKAGNAVKRLQARVSAPFSDLQYALVNPSDNLIPEYGLRTAGAICKRLQLFKQARLALVEASPTVSAYCNFNVSVTPEEQGPPLIFYADNYSLAYQGKTTLYWEIEDASATACTGSGGVWGDGTALDTSGGKLKIGPLATSVTYSVDCVNADSQSTTATVYIRVDSPPLPELQFYADSTSLAYNGKTSLHWNVSGGPATWCWATGGPWDSGMFVGTESGSQKVGPLTTSQTYTMQCGNDTPDYHDYKTPIISLTVQVAPQYPPPVLSFSAAANPIIYNTKANLIWNIDGGPATWCWGWGSTWGTDQAHGQWKSNKASNSEKVGPFISGQIYNLQCGNNSPNYNDYKTPVKTVTIKIGPKPKLTVKVSGYVAADAVTATGISCSNNGNTGDCTEEYDSTTKVTLTAVPSSGSKLESWDGPCTVKTNKCTVTVDTAMTVQANFVKK